MGQQKLYAWLLGLFSALGTGLDNGWRWVALLGVFAAVYGVFGSLAFGPLMEDT